MRSYWENIQVEEKIGEGSFSRVYKVKNKKTNEVFALKEIELDKDYHSNFMNEILPSHIVHPNLIKYDVLFVDERPEEIKRVNQKDSNIREIDINLNEIQFSKNYLKRMQSKENTPNHKKNKKYFYLQCEYHEYSLNTFLIIRNDLLKKESVTDNKLLKGIFKSTFDIKNNHLEISRLFCAVLFRNIIKGILYLHMNNILHCDLKSNNILIKEENNLFVPRVIDYGLKKLTEKNFEKDHKQLGVIYFEILSSTSTIMELGKLKHNLKKFKILPEEFNSTFKEEKKIILKCINNKEKSVSDTSALLHDMDMLINDILKMNEQ